MKHNKNYVALLGIISSTLVLGACSSQPGGFFGGYYYPLETSSEHVTTHSSPSYTTYDETTGYSSYSSDYTYSAPQTTVISESAPYGASVGHTTHHSSHPSGKSPKMRGPMKFSYGSLGTTLYDVDYSAVGVQARYGYQVNRILAAEAEGSLGVISDKEDFAPDVELSNNVDYQIATFAKARLPVTKKIALHARGGYHQTDIVSKLTEDDVFLGTTLDEDGFAYGGGAEYKLNNRDSLRLDYTRYEADIEDLDSISLGYQRRF